MRQIYYTTGVDMLLFGQNSVNSEHSHDAYIFRFRMTHSLIINMIMFTTNKTSIDLFRNHLSTSEAA